MAKKNKPQHNKVMAELRRRLLSVGLKTESICVAKGGSCYFKFEDERMGKCRIGDHNERTRYGYRWQIRTDIVQAYTSLEKGHKQFFVPAQKLDVAVAQMVNYYNAIQRNVERESYPPNKTTAVFDIYQEYTDMMAGD